ncbi:photosynthetic complex putative assembly protein PuhB [Roseospira goensis]|uniref:YdbS-like PH domain-containing protein n=1 Tax=Roseospira goensis TaxID=391922 RepID=A0A7W6RX72_9PROT|nr:hypothetical protein [Roseospira goensis]
MHDDFAVEPIPGLPERPPEGERVLWQGRPRWWSLSKRLFLVPVIGTYFGILAIWSGVSAAYDGAPAGAVAMAVVTPLLIGGVAAGLLMLVALWIQRSTIYTITSERVIVRFGLAFQMTVNLPFRVIKEAQLRVFRDGTGNIPLVLMPGQSVSGLMLWPHVRPWQWVRPQPMLRAIPVPEAVARTLAGALSDHAARTGAEAPEAPDAASRSAEDAAAAPSVRPAGAAPLADAAP